MIRDIHTTFSVGLSVGSVPPNAHHNCVRNVTFRNAHMTVPIKGIYVKSNPGTHGTGLIENINYENISGDGSLWYPIWIGPQQQHQPRGHGTGCSFFYPIDPVCPTNPLVTILNIRLVNVTFVNSLLMPGVVLCDKSNPCTGMLFDNVTVSGQFDIRSTWSCHNLQQPTLRNVSPPLQCQ